LVLIPSPAHMLCVGSFLLVASPCRAIRLIHNRREASAGSRPLPAATTRGSYMGSFTSTQLATGVEDTLQE
jgi:hypothetical protein